jgi:hypothetical protein
MPSSTTPPKITSARNTLASIIDSLLPPDPESKEHEWSRSALQQQRKAAFESEKSKPASKKSYEEDFPTLGGAGGDARILKLAAATTATTATTATSETKPTGSFASLAANWAKSEEENKATEAHAARLRLEQQQRDEFERSQRTQLYFNRNSGNQYKNNYNAFTKTIYIS